MHVDANRGASPFSKLALTTCPRSKFLRDIKRPRPWSLKSPMAHTGGSNHPMLNWFQPPSAAPQAQYHFIPPFGWNAHQGSMMPKMSPQICVDPGLTGKAWMKPFQSSLLEHPHHISAFNHRSTMAILHLPIAKVAKPVLRAT